MASTKVQGGFFSVHLSKSRMTLKLFRFFPLATVRISAIEYMRAASFSEYARHSWNIFLHTYWPTTGTGSNMYSNRYVVRTIGGRKIFVRLNPSLHYALRSSIGSRIRARRRRKIHTLDVERNDDQIHTS